MCTAQLSVESPFSWVKDTPALSPSVAVSDRTEPESLGQPEPEKTRRVIVGEVGGAARASRGRVRRVRERMVGGGGAREWIDDGVGGWVLEGLKMVCGVQRCPRVYIWPSRASSFLYTPVSPLTEERNADHQPMKFPHRRIAL
jgi:hypothetical protein